MKPLIIAGTEFKSRLFLGTGKFPSAASLKESIEASGTQLVTVALRRVDVKKDSANDDILSAIDRKKVTIMLNTSGARDAADALRIAKIARAAGFDWIKLEIHPEPNYLLPDPIETLIAAEKLVKDGFKVLPYINADPVLAKRLEDVGVHAVMPLGSPIGSGQGIRTEAMLRIIIEQANVPVVVDAGIGLPSHAAAAIEMGASAVLVNTAVAAAGSPAKMARAFALAVEAAELALEAYPITQSAKASASSPSNVFSSPI
jgi:thiazole synthase